MCTKHQIIALNGRYIAYDAYGSIVTWADTYDECECNLIKMIISAAYDNLNVNC